MRIGIISDLHYGFSGEVTRTIDGFIESTLAPADLDVLAIAGDVAESEGLAGSKIGSRHERLLTHLRAATGCPVAFCAGNHDIWSTDPGVNSWLIYRERLSEAAGRTETTYLDRDNLNLPGLTVVGCYGHFDFSLRTPGLRIRGETVTERHYRRQTPPGYAQPVWMDGQRIAWSYSDDEACAEICRLASQRMEAAVRRGRPILFLSHTVPRSEVNGHHGSTAEKSLFLNAFSGTSRLEKVIREGVGETTGLIAAAGHTHRRIAPLEIDGVTYLNAGGDYGKPHLEIIELAAEGCDPQEGPRESNGQRAPAGQKAPTGQNAPAGQKAPAGQNTPHGQSQALP
jgi:predicted phosphodiesterase